MFNALCDDAARFSDVTWTAADGAVAHHEFDRLAAEATWTIVIAPESDGVLLRLADRVRAMGGRLLGSHREVIKLTSDKHRTAEHLRRQGVPAPVGRVLADGESLPTDFPFPAVLKPLDGAGSQDTFLIERPWRAPSTSGRRWRLEQYCSGIAASVAVLCGPMDNVPLEPCRQRLSADGRFQYLGGSLPLEPRSGDFQPPREWSASQSTRTAVRAAPAATENCRPGGLAERATRLALAAVATLPGALGYLGVDLVLGEDAGGRHDYVIEINPRLTTSYVGLRAATGDNLAAAMVHVAAGCAPKIHWRNQLVAFDSDGTIQASSRVKA